MKALQFVLLPLLLLCGTFLATAQGSSVVSALSVPLALPSAVAIAPDGSVYVAERGAHTVRRIDGAGTLTLIAGTGIQGFSGDGALAVHASLDSPQGLAFSPSGVLYITDTHNNRIRSIDPVTGIISTVAGTGVRGFAGDGGPAAAAEFASPSALVFGPDGTLYFADTGNQRIRSISPNGTISTVAGTTQGFSGEGTSAIVSALDTPSGLAVDARGNLYIADSHNHRIRKLDVSNGVLQTLAGDGTATFSGDGSPASLARLAFPRGVSVSSTGEVYIVDSANQRIRKIGSDGIISTIAGNGIQGFSGDGGQGAAASIDSPYGAAISSQGITFFADTGNQRVRQLSNSNTLQTVAGVGTAPLLGTLTLSASSVLFYGSGSLLASLQSSQAANGSVTFLSLSAGATATLGSAALRINQATLDLANLDAGPYSVFATYAGDVEHGAAQSSVLVFTIAPHPITAVPNPVTLLYGQTVPALTGSVSGVLSRDQQSVTVQFVSGAGLLSPPGTYPISAVLSGSTARDYAVTNTGGSVSVARAPTAASLTITSFPAQPGLPITFSAQVASSTSGSPTGSLSLLDGASLLAMQPLGPTGIAALTISDLSPGIHNFSAAYLGDSNFLPSASAGAPILIAAGVGSSGADFTLATVGSSLQNVTAGTTALYSFAVQPQGSLSSPITLAVSGLPPGATSSFSPAYLPPSGPATFTLTIMTPKATLARSAGHLLGTAPLSVALLFLPLSFLMRKSWRLRVLSCSAIVSLVVLAGCGDRIYSTTKNSPTFASYTLTINASATSPSGAVLVHSATVTLSIQ